jgi:hypothetical protein
MPSRPLEVSIKIRQWVEAAIDGGYKNPRAIQEYIAQNADIDPPPSIPTIGNIMREMGYDPAGKDWIKRKGK